MTDEVEPWESAQALALAEACVRRALAETPDDAHVTFFPWRPARTVACIGLAQSAERELHLSACRDDGVEPLRRASGGGAVVLTDGVLCWEAWASEKTLGDAAGIRAAYRALSRPVLDSLAELGLPAAMAGISDLAWTGAGKTWRKIAGTAQFRRRGWVWVHGSLLVRADVAGFSRWLREPSEAPDYRAGRDHRRFCATVAEGLGRDVTVEAAAAALHAAAARLGWRPATPTDESRRRAEEILREKYGCPEWNLRGHQRENRGKDGDGCPQFN